jgi:hypothetical protein
MVDFAISCIYTSCLSYHESFLFEYQLQCDQLKGEGLYLTWYDLFVMSASVFISYSRLHWISHT